MAPHGWGGGMKWIWSGLAAFALSDRCLYLGTAVLLVGGTLYYVHLDMQRNDQPTTAILIYQRMCDGYAEFDSIRMDFANAEGDDVSTWAVSASTNPAKSEFEIYFRPASTSRAAKAADRSPQPAVFVDGVRLNPSRPHMAEREPSPYSIFAGGQSDLAAMSDGKHIIFEVGGKRYATREADRVVLKALLRVLEGSTASRQR